MEMEEIELAWRAMEEDLWPSEQERKERKRRICRTLRLTHAHERSRRFYKRKGGIERTHK